MQSLSSLGRYSPGGLQSPAAVTQCGWSSARWGSEERRRDVRPVWAPLYLLFIKCKKGRCERGVKKGDLNEGFLGEVDFREKLVWKLPRLMIL